MNSTSEDPPQLNPDISGPGVVFAYFASSVIAVGAVILGFNLDALPEKSYNEFDRRMLQSKKKRPGLRQREKRQEAFQRFIIASSDQQLVGGITLMVGALSSTKDIALADFRVATSLAWLSATVHLATLIALRDYLYKHVILRRIRLACMSIALGLLLSGLVISSAANSNPSDVSLQYVFQNFSVTSDSFDLSSILVIVILFTNSIVVMHTPIGRRGYSLPLLVVPVRFLCLLFTRPDTRRLLQDKNVRSQLRSFTASEVELAWLERRGQSRIWNCMKIYQCYFAESFCFSFGWLALSFFYGQILFLTTFLDTILPSRGDATRNIEFDYGQTLPILLLTLPFLAACESVFEIKDESVQPDTLDMQSDKIDLNSEPQDGEPSSSDLEPAVVRFDRAFEEKSSDLQYYFPLEYSKISLSTGEESHEGKQILLLSLSNLKLRKTQLLQSKNPLLVIFFLHNTYSLGICYLLVRLNTIGAWSLSLFSPIFWPVYIPGLLAILTLAWPYMMCYVHLTKYGNQEKQARLLEYLRLQAQKDESQGTPEAGIPLVAITTSSNPSAGPHRVVQRQWTL